MEEQFGDENIVPFSFTNKPDDLKRELASCWLTYTNEETHKIIIENIDRSPLFSGIIKGTGPRYCPSIEDKVMRFSDKNRHQVFIEPEGLYTNEMYIGGMSSSLPEDLQYKMYRSVKGLENEKIQYDVVVVGAGHAGCEAALAASRLGLNTIMFTVSVDCIALMPCNPNVGGSSKGHLVRELDALGGDMGKNIDKTFIQSKMLNMSKGPAVHSLRAQADKLNYSNEMRRTLENTENLTIKQGEIIELIVEDNKIVGVKSYTGRIYNAKSVVLASGNYFKSRCITGDISEYTGPNGLKSANYLTDSLKSLGIEMYRFKTGTPARIDKNSIDFSKMEEQFGDENIVPFSFTNKPEDLKREQASCWLTYTNEETHKIIRENLHRSPLYAGVIEGTGTRYCPSIEDKVVRFNDKERHQ